MMSLLEEGFIRVVIIRGMSCVNYTRVMMSFEIQARIRRYWGGGSPSMDDDS
jgi:hypothetical protein